MNIRGKILYAMILAVALSIMGVIAMASYEMDEVFENNYKTSSQAQLDRMDAFAQNFFSSARSMVDFLATSEVIRNNIGIATGYLHTKETIKTIGDLLPEAERGMYKILQRVNEAYPAYLLVYVSNNDGGITQAPDDVLSAGFNPSKRPWYIDTVKAGKTILTEAYISDSGGAVFTVATPIRNDANDISGVAAIDISLDTLTEETGSVKIGNTGYVLLVDSLGQVVSDPKNSSTDVAEENRWLGKFIKDLPGDAAKAMQTLRDLKNGYLEVSINGVDWLASIKTTPSNWSIVMLQERDEVYAGAMDVTMVIGQVGLVIAIIMLAVAWAVARSIATPIVILAKASHAVAEGDLQAIPQDEKAFSGEIGVLHRSLMSMVGKLVELIETANGKIKEAEQALQNSQKAYDAAEEAKKQAEVARSEGALSIANQIGSIADQLTHAIHLLEAESKEAGNKTREQQERVDGTAQAITQMNESVVDVASSTARTAALAEETRTEAQKGKELVFELVGSMNEIENKAQAMQKSLSTLKGQAVDIGQIMNIISDIADQTNLLALNAAIEAARAGEAGRGFAVVADEVRKLAEKTMEATKQVEVSVSAIQNGAEENMKGIEQTVAFVSESTSVAHNAGEALAHIESMIENTANETRSIASASEEQSSTIEEINNRTDELRHLTVDVAESTNSSYTAVQDLAELSRGLSQVMDDLKKSN